MTLRNFFAKSDEAHRISQDRRHVIIVKGGAPAAPNPSFAPPSATPTPVNPNGS